jgi:hypothetical protein
MDVQRAQRQVKGSLRRERVDASSVAQQITAEPEEQDQYIGYLQARGVKDLVFRPDPKETDRLLRFTEFDGDFGLRVRVQSSAIGQGQTLWWELDPATGDTLVTIRTKEWVERP